ncbi:MAG: tRNA 2-thiouridine(34) synthase MnmA [Candidatus Nealsonbacteria bacterium]|nr:tRNA 2-thiouridine(34) synthase MnmA [Candidatus Nealsonbacteria bacterium]
MIKNKEKIKVIVAMSGGVDSSVAAALLNRAGFNVVGVFMKFWVNPQNRCCSPEAQERARRVAAKLKIPFYVFNFEKEFKKRIVDYFLREYKAGRTPNPCIVCNKEIKFGLLLEKALSLGVDRIATGHYARIVRHSMSNKLLMAKDKKKDQSYFLWQLNQKQLSRVLFPLANYTKPEVRKMAEKFDLPNYATPDSQEICFVPNTVNDFLAKHIKQKKGEIVNVNGRVLGEHNGLEFYTIGQRRGIGLSGGPYWVADKDLDKNVLIVTKKEKDLLKKKLTFKNANWISGVETRFPIKVKAKIRYRSNLVSAALSKNKVIFDKPQRAITPGQSAVFYSGRELLGGGTIDKIL